MDQKPVHGRWWATAVTKKDSESSCFHEDNHNHHRDCLVWLATMQDYRLLDFTMMSKINNPSVVSNAIRKTHKPFGIFNVHYDCFDDYLHWLLSL